MSTTSSMKDHNLITETDPLNSTNYSLTYSETSPVDSDDSTQLSSFSPSNFTEDSDVGISGSVKTFQSLTTGNSFSGDLGKSFSSNSDNSYKYISFLTGILLLIFIIVLILFLLRYKAVLMPRSKGMDG